MGFINSTVDFIFHDQYSVCVCMCSVSLGRPTSAVDSHVGAGLFAKGIISSLKNRGKGVVLGT